MSRSSPLHPSPIAPCRHASGRPASSPPPAHVLEPLEQRRLLAAPEIAPLPDFGPIPAGKTLFLPVNTSDADGDAVTLGANVAPGDASFADAEFISNDNTWLQMDVEGYGNMLFELYDDVAPETVRRISGLANTGFYDGLEIFRVVPDFVFQFGSPANDGTNIVDPGPDEQRGTADDVISPEFRFDDEFDPNVLFTGDGQLAMANSGKDTNSSQFFVTDGSPRFLDGNHTIFGQLVRGFGVRNEIMAVETGENDRPTDPPVVTSVRTVSNETDGVLRITTTPAAAGEEINLNIIAIDENGETTSRPLAINAVTDTSNSPPVFRDFDDTLTTPVNTPIVIDIPAVDPEGDPLTFTADLFDPATGQFSDEAGTVTVDETSQQVTYTPATDFTGRANLFVRVAQVGETGRGSVSNDPYDKQVITIGVGDSEAVGSANDVGFFRNRAGEERVVATFNDLDPEATADDWTARIDWGDGTVTDGRVVASDDPGSFDVLGSHAYDTAAQNIPVTVTVTGDRGAELELVGSASVVGEANVNDEGTFEASGTDGDDIISLGISNGIVEVRINGVTQTFNGDDIQRIILRGGAGDDAIVLDENAPAAEIYGGAGNDTLVGALNNDELYGEDGNDSLDGSGGNDRIEGGAGNDYLMGGTDLDYDDATLAAGYFDRDSLFGGDGDDTLSGGLDVNFLDGGAGNDLLNGSGSRDSLFGGLGNDRLRGYGNADTLDGGDGDDILEGDALDGPRGGDFADVDDGDDLRGGDGNDILIGRFDNDLFAGGPGADQLFGGEGDEDEDLENDPLDTRDGIEIVPST